MCAHTFRPAATSGATTCVAMAAFTAAISAGMVVGHGGVYERHFVALISLTVERSTVAFGRTANSLPSSEFMRARTAVTFPPFSGLMLEGRSVTSTLTDH